MVTYHFTCYMWLPNKSNNCHSVRPYVVWLDVLYCNLNYSVAWQPTFFLSYLVGGRYVVPVVLLTKARGRGTTLAAVYLVFFALLWTFPGNDRAKPSIIYCWSENTLDQWFQILGREPPMGPWNLPWESVAKGLGPFPFFTAKCLTTEVSVNPVWRKELFFFFFTFLWCAWVLQSQ